MITAATIGDIDFHAILEYLPSKSKMILEDISDGYGDSVHRIKAQRPQPTKLVVKQFTSFASHQLLLDLCTYQIGTYQVVTLNLGGTSLGYTAKILDVTVSEPTPAIGLESGYDCSQIATYTLELDR